MKSEGIFFEIRHFWGETERRRRKRGDREGERIEEGRDR